MIPADDLAYILPDEVIVLLVSELRRVTHPGVTTVELVHGPDGRITAAQVAAAPPRVKVKAARRGCER
jgi:hypothetical protein